MKTLFRIAIVLLWVSSAAEAQRPQELQIRLGLYTTAPDGGEKAAGMWYSTGRAILGKAFVSTWSIGEPCESFAVSGAGGGLTEQPVAAWRIEVTPTSIDGDAVKFRLRWQMSDLRPKAARAGPFSDDRELTLQPGESRPLIAVRSFAGMTCDDAASIRVSVDAYPSEQEESRLIATDLWLVEAGTNRNDVQRSQPIALRGLPNRPSTFYFDRITDGNDTLDLYGEVIAKLDGDEVTISMETRSRWRPEARNIMGPQKEVTSVIRLKPGETVEVRLPLLGVEAGSFAKRAFSIRIRARQLR